MASERTKSQIRKRQPQKQSQTRLYTLFLSVGLKISNNRSKTEKKEVIKEQAITLPIFFVI